VQHGLLDCIASFWVESMGIRVLHSFVTVVQEYPVLLRWLQCGGKTGNVSPVSVAARLYLIGFCELSSWCQT
jgi:hypothetical protein